MHVYAFWQKPAEDIWFPRAGVVDDCEWASVDPQLGPSGRATSKLVSHL